MKDKIQRAVRDITNAKHITALTGSGISVESGIPPFRGKGSIWEKFDPVEYAHINAFMKDPVKIWQTLLKDMKTTLDAAKPNDGHLGLSVLETMGYLKTIITQNVDGLHQKAGNTDVIEFHGTFAEYHCLDCHTHCSSGDIDLSLLPPRCECGGIYRPECVFFGEMIPQDILFRAGQVAETSNVMLVIGTSAVVQPAAFMPVIAKENGATIIEINPEFTPLTGQVADYTITGNAGTVMNQIIRGLTS